MPLNPFSEVLGSPNCPGSEWLPPILGSGSPPCSPYLELTLPEGNGIIACSQRFPVPHGELRHRDFPLLQGSAENWLGSPGLRLPSHVLCVNTSSFRSSGNIYRLLLPYGTEFLEMVSPACHPSGTWSRWGPEASRLFVISCLPHILSSSHDHSCWGPQSCPLSIPLPPDIQAAFCPLKSHTGF